MIALDSPTDPQSATDALFATDNYKAGVLIGQYAKAALGRQAGEDRHARSRSRHHGRRAAPQRLPAGLRPMPTRRPIRAESCAADSYGDQAKGQTAMENCLQKEPGHQRRLHDQRAGRGRRLSGAEGGGQGEGRDDRLGRRRLRRREERQGRRHRRDLAAVPAEDGVDGRRGRRRVREGRQEGRPATPTPASR